MNYTEIKQELIIYSTDDGRTRVEVRMTGDSVWLSQAQMADLFHTTKQNISGHIKNILNEDELDNSVVKDFFTTASDGKNYNCIPGIRGNAGKRRNTNVYERLDSGTG